MVFIDVRDVHRACGLLRAAAHPEADIDEVTSWVGRIDPLAERVLRTAHAEGRRPAATLRHAVVLLGCETIAEMARELLRTWLASLRSGAPVQLLGPPSALAEFGEPSHPFDPRRPLNPVAANGPTDRTAA